MDPAALAKQVLLGSKQSVLMTNPHWGLQQAQDLLSLYEKYKRPHHFYFSSSGSETALQDSVKLVALSNRALLGSAHAVTKHLNVESTDIWGVALPIFHVGGFAVYLRAALLGLKIVQLLNPSGPSWNPQFFVQSIVAQKVTLTSLVPTQVFDLVQEGLHAPKSLRALVVGGAALSADLYEQARSLGWPLLPSYGLTECSSQVATASLETLTLGFQSELRVLNHVELDCLPHIRIKSDSLLTEYLQMKSGKAFCWSPLDSQGWFETKDLGELIGNHSLLVKGRDSRWVKILGEGISLDFLTEKWVKLAPELTESFAILAIPDIRKGQKLIGVVEKPVLEKRSLEQLKTVNKTLPSLEQISDFLTVDRIPKSPLGKVLFTELESEVERIQPRVRSKR